MTSETPLQSGLRAPDFLLRDLDGHAHTLSHYLGRVVVLNFWSAECPWSERADAELAAFTAGWGKRVAWISIAPNANEAEEQIRGAAAARSLSLVLRDPDRAVTELYGAEMTPHIYVIDETGALRYQGGFDDVSFRQPVPTRNHAREAVDALLAGRLPEVSEAPAYGCTIVFYPE